MLVQICLTIEKEFDTVSGQRERENRVRERNVGLCTLQKFPFIRIRNQGIPVYQLHRNRSELCKYQTVTAFIYLFNL